MPWRSTDVVKERTKFLLEWERRWNANGWSTSLLCAASSALAEIRDIDGFVATRRRIANSLRYPRIEVSGITPVCTWRYRTGRGRRTLAFAQSDDIPDSGARWRRLVLNRPR